MCDQARRVTRPKPDDDEFDEPDPRCRCATTLIPPCAFCEGSTDPDLPAGDAAPYPGACSDEHQPAHDAGSRPAHCGTCGGGRP